MKRDYKCEVTQNTFFVKFYSDRSDDLLEFVKLLARLEQNREQPALQELIAMAENFK